MYLMSVKKQLILSQSIFRNMYRHHDTAQHTIRLGSHCTYFRMRTFKPQVAKVSTVCVEKTFALVAQHSPPIHTYHIVSRNSKCQPFLMCPGWSFQSLLLGTIYDTSLDNYIPWVNAKVFLSNRRPPKLIWIKQCLILPYRNAVQEAQTFVKMADICCYGLRYGKCE